MGGELALDAAWLFAALLIVLILAAGGIAARRFLLERGGGTVECGLRKGNGSWRLGVASYQPEELCWFGIFGLSMRPDEVFPRRDLTVVARRLPTQAEAATLGPGMIVVECQLGQDGGQLGSPAADGTQGPAAAPASARVPTGGSASGAGASGGGPGGASRPGNGATGRGPGGATSRDPGGATGPGGPGRAAGPGRPGRATGPGRPGRATGPGSGGAGRGGGGAGQSARDAGQRETVELALGEEALTGLLAWLEAAPPGFHLGLAL